MISEKALLLYQKRGNCPGTIIGRQFSQVGIIRGVVVRGQLSQVGNVQWGIVRWLIVLGNNCLGGNFLEGNCPGVNCPVSAFLDYNSDTDIYGWNKFVTRTSFHIQEVVELQNVEHFIKVERIFKGAPEKLKRQ